MPMLRSRPAQGAVSPTGQPFAMKRDSPQSRGLAAWWPALGQIGVGTLLDFGMRGNHGAFGASTAAPSWLTDPLVTAKLSFDGSNDEITLPTTFKLNTAGAWAVSYWCYLTETAFAGNSAFPVTMALPDVTGQEFYVGFFNNAGQYDGLTLGNSGTYGSLVLPTVSQFQNTWAHLIISHAGGTFNATNAIGYMNGVPKTLSAGGGTQNNALTQGWIGRYFGSNGFFKGYLSDVRVYDRPISAAEAWQMFDPQTRWELYQPLRNRAVYTFDAAGGILRQMLTHHGAVN